MQIATTHTHPIYLKVQQALSIDRIARYHLPSDTHPCDTLGRYHWNMALCEALYPALQTVEIVLRNTIHDAITAEFGTPYWFDLTPVPFEPFVRQSVAKARYDLAKRGKDGIRRSLTASDIVAELNFGVWTSLLNVAYDRVLWPSIIRPAFPRLPVPLQKRQVLSKRFRVIKELRNRVFHHEPIWHWRDLEAQYDQLLEAIGWINPEISRVLAALDRFRLIKRRGHAPFCPPLRAIIV